MDDLRKPTKQLRSPRRMRRGTTPINPIGAVSRAHSVLNVELTAKATKEGWFYHCELRAVLVEMGLAGGRCSMELTFAHSKKHRGGDPVLDREVCRGCTNHHYFCLDELHPRLQTKIVREVISRRNMTSTTTQLPLIKVKSCPTCLSVLTKSPSHDSRFSKHLNHATIGDLRLALDQTIETKTARQMISGKLKYLEVRASWEK